MIPKNIKVLLCKLISRLYDENRDFDKLNNEQKKEIIKVVGEGLLYFTCRKLHIDYFDLKKKGII